MEMVTHVLLPSLAILHSLINTRDMVTPIAPVLDPFVHKNVK